MALSDRTELQTGVKRGGDYEGTKQRISDETIAMGSTVRTTRNRDRRVKRRFVILSCRYPLRRP